MPTNEASLDDARYAAAAAFRDLNHALVRHDADATALATVADAARSATAVLQQAPLRDRLALMRAAAATGENMIPGLGARVGFEDRAVAGRANPTSVDIDVRFEGDEVVADVVLRKAFEGAPGRAHGGIVAAAFDDVTGFVIGMLHEPAFTGELTVRYLAPVPVDTPLELRARLDGRERRKLFISAEARVAGSDDVIATCRAIYITIDPAKFAAAPDPR